MPQGTFRLLLFLVASALHVFSIVQLPKVYTKDNSGQTLNRDGDTITISPSQTYDIYCADDQYNKHWYTVIDQSQSLITRLWQETTSPDVYAINTAGNTLTLQFRPFQSTHAGEYECGFTSNGRTLTPLSIFLTPSPPPPPSKVQGVTVARTVQGSSPALRVSWSAVSGSGITYTVCYSTTSGTQSDPPPTANCDTSGITGTSTTLGPLRRGTTYYIWVAAVSSGVRGPYSRRISAAVEQRIYIIDASEGTVDLDNGATLTITPSKTYDIWCSDTSYVKDWHRVLTQSASSISRYWYRETLPDVYATNPGGYALALHFKSFQSTDSGEYECRLRPSGLPTLSVFLTPSPPPLPPKVQGVTATKSVQGSSPALRVSWSAVSGSGITYTVCYSTTRGTQFDPPSVANCGTSGITGTSTTLGPPSRGTTYYIWVSAVSSGGRGPYSDRRHNITYNVPGPVTSLQVRPSSTIFGLIITWGLPSGGNYPTPVTYRLRYRERPSSESPGGWSRNVQRTATQRQYTTPVLKPGTRYEVKAWALSSIGNSQRVTRAAITYDLPGPVTSLEMRPSTAIIGLVITWEPPFGSNYPTPVTYQLRYRERPSSGPPGGWSSTAQRTATQRQYTTPVLKPGTRYEVEVWASFRLEDGESVLRTITTIEVPPPNDVSVYPLPQPGTVRVTWTPPNTTHGLNVTGYAVECRKVDTGGQLYKEHLLRTSTITEQTTSVDLIGLELGQEYYVRVAVATIAGMGTYSDPVNVTTYADCCSGCSSVRSSTFATFKSSSKMVSEDTAVVHIDVYRYGPMERPLILRVIDEPGTALKVLDYSLQSSELYFINTQEVVEQTTVVVKINNDDVVERGPPETFNLTLYSPDPNSNVVFSVHVITVSIVDNDY